jgi:hypothetical protein
VKIGIMSATYRRGEVMFRQAGPAMTCEDRTLRHLRVAILGPSATPGMPEMEGNGSGLGEISLKSARHLLRTIQHSFG